uniref:Uncharacterized protein n=1 Tax=Arundo donax TaxID=35708 RepID=A0A0A8Z1P3_ARUDO
MHVHMRCSIGNFIKKGNSRFSISIHLNKKGGNSGKKKKDHGQLLTSHVEPQ